MRACRGVPMRAGPRRATVSIAALLVATLCALPAHAREASGRAAFERAGCDMCHGAEGGGEGVDPLLLPMTRDLAGLTAIVRQGFGHMPRMSRSEVSDAELAEIHRWLRKLGDTSGPGERAGTTSGELP